MNDRIVIYIFDCPVHGPENSSLCWKAYLPENRLRWSKKELMLMPIELGEEELDQILNEPRLGGFNPYEENLRINISTLFLKAEQE